MAQYKYDPYAVANAQIGAEADKTKAVTGLIAGVASTVATGVRNVDTSLQMYREAMEKRNNAIAAYDLVDTISDGIMGKQLREQKTDIDNIVPMPSRWNTRVNEKLIERYNSMVEGATKAVSDAIINGSVPVETVKQNIGIVKNYKDVFAKIQDAMNRVTQAQETQKAISASNEPGYMPPAPIDSGESNYAAAAAKYPGHAVSAPGTGSGELTAEEMAKQKSWGADLKGLSASQKFAEEMAGQLHKPEVAQQLRTLQEREKTQRGVAAIPEGSTQSQAMRTATGGEGLTPELREMINKLPSEYQNNRYDIEAMRQRNNQIRNDLELRKLSLEYLKLKVGDYQKRQASIQKLIGSEGAIKESLMQANIDLAFAKKGAPDPNNPGSDPVVDEELVDAITDGIKELEGQLKAIDTHKRTMRAASTAEPINVPGTKIIYSEAGARVAGAPDELANFTPVPGTGNPVAVPGTLQVLTKQSQQEELHKIFRGE